MTLPDGHGGFPCAPGYGKHNGIGPEQTEGRNIFVMYDGQYSTAGDQIYHYWEDGLMVGQFGNTSPHPDNFLANIPVGQANNVAAMATVLVNEDVYLYHTDESDHSPLQRWHVSDLDSVHEFGGSASIGKGSIIQLNKMF